jgi:hypothetical protein
MPLARYGVAIGTLIRFYRDPPDNFGRWYHGHVEVSTPSGMWTSALDVDTPNGVGISYRTSGKLDPSVLGPVRTLPHGFHFLPSNPTSGAIDYLRAGFLQDWFFIVRQFTPLGLPRTPQPLPPPLPPGAPPLPRPVPSLPGRLYEVALRLLNWKGDLLPSRFRIRFRPWLRSNGDNALKALEAELTGARKVYLFGQRFGGPDQGVHDVHQNQGDPVNSQWGPNNGIWQDGAVAVERENGTLFFWQVRFNSQATKTDSNGNPA